MQEEFFHTFNELYDHQKQIVISSDSTPKATPGLVERLRSRFEWGLMVDVQPPDLETKMAILDKKAEMEGVTLPEDVRIYIATKTKSNVRELEGALIKLIAYSSVTGSPITLSMAQQVLKYLIPGTASAASPWNPCCAPSPSNSNYSRPAQAEDQCASRSPIRGRSPCI